MNRQTEQENNRPLAALEPDTASAVPRFVLPEVVGVTLGAEALAEIVQKSVEEMAAGLECRALAALSYVPRERLLRGVTTVGIEGASVRTLNWPLTAFPAAESALRVRRPLVLPNAEGLPAPLADWLAGEIVVVPLVLGERPLAVLVGQVAPGAAVHSAAWLERAQETAARAALMVELERLASAYQDELQLRQSTRMVAAAILEGRPLPEVAGLIVETIAQRLSEERVALFLRDEAGKNRPVVLRNISAEYGEQATRLKRPAFSSRAHATGLPYFARDVQNDPQIEAEVRELLRREHIHSVLVARLQREETIQGALVVYPQSDRSFTPAELAVFQSFADMAALAVAITRQLEQQSRIAMMEERNRLAREMHDTVAQSLTGLLFQIETTQTCLEGDDRDTARDLLIAARALAKKALEDTRRAVQGLSPSSVERQSSVQAVAEEVSRFEAESGVPARFVATGEEQPLNVEQRTTLLRIAQESLSNVRKHAQARRVRVGLQYGAQAVTLRIEDDGIGFDPTARPAPGPEGGYGVFGMMERARLSGGEVRIDSTPGWGTTVQVMLPYRPASPLPPRREPTDFAGTPALSPSVPDTLAPASAGPPNASPGSVPAAAPLSGSRSEPPAAASADGNADMLRVLIADDHAMVRQGLRSMLEATGAVTVIGEAADGAEAAERAAALHPDVVLMDLQMPNVDGLEGLRRIHAEQPELPVVILTTFQTDASVKEALSAGARGYLLKDAEPADLVAALRAARRGEALLAPAVTARLSTPAMWQTAVTEPANVLNDRELEVLDLLAQGARNKEIAAQLFITVSTVEYHLSNIYAKLGVSNRAEAVRAAIERNLVSK
jgi:DNA-binding NarL/FixJ family response regulator/signal transduction histidine kinase